VDVKLIAAFVMTPVPSSLASKWKSWVAIAVAFTTNAEVVFCQVYGEKCMLYEAVIGATLLKFYSYKKKSVAVFQKASTFGPNAIRIWNY
jgi:hypothetical protein